MVLGGVPFYYSLLDPALSLSQNIDRLFFNEGALLKLEFEELYNAHFRQCRPVHVNRTTTQRTRIGNDKQGHIPVTIIEEQQHNQGDKKTLKGPI